MPQYAICVLKTKHKNTDQEKITLLQDLSKKLRVQILMLPQNYINVYTIRDQHNQLIFHPMTGSLAHLHVSRVGTMIHLQRALALAEAPKCWLAVAESSR